jgi:cell division protein FtsQ
MVKRNSAGGSTKAKAGAKTGTKTPPKGAMDPLSFPTTKRRLGASAAAVGGVALTPAGRRRVKQRRKERITRQVRKLEAVLPGTAAGTWRPSLPDVAEWPLYRLLRARGFLLTVLLIVVAGATAAWVHTDDRWFLYREDARFGGLTYLTEDELWQASEIDGWNMFWLDTNEVRSRLLANPYVSDVDVYISPVPGAVNIDVTEALPVALWVTDDGTRWLLTNGTAVEPRGGRPPAPPGPPPPPTPAGLMQIIDNSAMATAPGAALGSAIDADVLASAESLLQVLPGVAPLRYNRQIGLNFQLQNKPYWVYWGDGANVQRKLENLDAAVQLLEDGTLAGTVIDVRFERPYVK